MPEIDRGVAVAYCRQSGPLEATPLPTEFAVSPTPADWSRAQVDSFYREYNDHMLHNLTVHEAMPGHALQLMHANRHRGAHAGARGLVERLVRRGLGRLRRGAAGPARLPLGLARRRRPRRCACSSSRCGCG